MGPHQQVRPLFAQDSVLFSTGRYGIISKLETNASEDIAMNEKTGRTRSLLGRFLSYFKNHRKLFALDISCAFLIALIDLAFPLVSRTAMYHWLPERKFTVFFAVMACVVVAYMIRSCLNFVVCYWGHTFGIRVEADIRRDLFAHMQELGFDFYDRNRTG